jgi:hypothetical protein
VDLQSIDPLQAREEDEQGVSEPVGKARKALEQPRHSPDGHLQRSGVHQ